MPGAADTLASNIRKYRKRAKLTQAQLAAKIGMASQTISNLENGEQWVGEPAVGLLAAALGVEETDLFYPGEPPKPPEHSIEECRRRVGIDVVGAIEIMGALRAERKAGVDGPISKRLFEQIAEIENDGD